MRIHTSVIKAAAIFADRGSAMPALANVCLAHEPTDGTTTLTATDLYTSVTYSVLDPSHAAELNTVAAPEDWLHDVCRMVGKRPVAFAIGDGCVVGAQNAVGGGPKLRGYGMPAADFPEVASPPDDATWHDLAPADFGKGGAVASALSAASSDMSRPHVNAIHIKDGLVEGTDGKRAARHYLARGIKDADLLVSADAAKKILKLAAATAPDAMSAAHIGKQLFVRGRCYGVALGEWTVAVKLVDAEFPNIDDIEKENLPNLTACVQIDAADLKSLWRPFGKDATIAVFPDGTLLCWDFDRANFGGGGCGTTCRVPDLRPVLTFFANVAKPALDALPKQGKIGLRYDPTNPMSPFLLGGVIVMPCVLRVEEDERGKKHPVLVPDGIYQELCLALGVEPAVEVTMREAA